MCELNSIIHLINNLNFISSPTDGEGDLIKHIASLAVAQNISVQTIKPKPYLKVAPILIGAPDAKFILVTHCDRKQENPAPLTEFNDAIKKLEGKLDNTISLAICLSLIMKIKPLNTSLLITTSEEGQLNPPVPNAGYLQGTGGRGLISFLEHNKQHIKDKFFICVDVRPLDNNSIFLETGVQMQLGDGLVLRINEIRNGVNISADPELLYTIRDCAIRNNINLVRYDCNRLNGQRTGITELGRGWERLLNRLGFPITDYHIAWLQPPILKYHTKHEQMSGKDIVALCKVIKCLIETFE